MIKISLLTLVADQSALNSGRRHVKVRMRAHSWILVAAVLSAASFATVRGDEVSSIAAGQGGPASSEKAPPLPLHQIEGYGGIFVTSSAYIVNPPSSGEQIGRPSLGIAYANLGHQVNVEAVTLTEAPFERLELGFGRDNFGLGDLPLALRDVGFAQYRQNEVVLYNYNARVELLKEGDFGQKWIPAVTLGAHYKYNDGIAEVNNEIAGLLASHGIVGHDGVDYTLYASKMFTQLPAPILLEVGGRATKAVWEGFGGFTGSYRFVAEGNVVVYLSRSVGLAAEYKEQPADYQPIGNLVQKASDWYTVEGVFIVNQHMTVAGGYGHFGSLLNHKANSVLGVSTKWEF